MGLVNLIKRAGEGALVAVAVVTAAPILGGAGVLTAGAATGASIVGGLAGAIDHIAENNK